jgi:hypothetical protein
MEHLIEELAGLAEINEWGKMQAKRAREITRQAFNFDYLGCFCTALERRLFRRVAISLLENYKKQKEENESPTDK